MDREGAETHLRLLAEATMRRALEAAREKPGPPDPGGHRTRLLTVGQALTAAGALDAVTLEEILVDFNLAMSVRQLSAIAEGGVGPGPGASPGTARAVRVARLFTQSQTPHQLPVAYVYPRGTDERGQPRNPDCGLGILRLHVLALRERYGQGHRTYRADVLT